MPWICAEPECKKQPYYAAPGIKKPQYCFLHKKGGHVDVRNKRCEVPNCEIRPHYGYDGEAPRFCAQHRAEGMHNLRSRRCQSEGCVRYASCGHAGNPPVFCGAHKTIGMVNLIGRRCAVDQCETYASYGVTGEKARYCAKHKGINMVNLTVKHCEFTGCVTQPSFNYGGQRKARYCARHRMEQMVDVLDRHCAQQGCDRQPIYGQAGEKEGRPMWCPDHRPIGSFDVKTSRCQEPGCLKHPSYGYDKDRIRRRCRLHKLDDMVDVKSPRCEMVGCRKQPCCGFPGLKPRFCSEHKQDGMLNLKTRAFRCKYRGPGHEAVHGMSREDPLMPAAAAKTAPCNRACRYAYPGEEAVYCAKHKINGMVDVVNPSCKMQDCPEEPTHGYDGEAATFCQAHMAVGMKPIAVLRPTGLHWSAELRRQATAQARERSLIEHEMETGSARCTPLPPKATTQEEKRKRQEDAATAAIEAAAAQARGPEAAAANLALNTREMLSASTSPIVPPFNNDDMGPSSITTAELALAFSGLPEDDMAAAAAAAASNPALPASHAAAGAFGGAFVNPPGFLGQVPPPALPGIIMDHLGRSPAAGGPESGPAKKRRRAPEPNAVATSQSHVQANPYAAAPMASSAFADPAATYHSAYSNELMASMTPTSPGGVSGGLLLPMTDVAPQAPSSAATTMPPFSPSPDAHVAAAIAASEMAAVSAVGVAPMSAPAPGVSDPSVMAAAAAAASVTAPGTVGVSPHLMTPTTMVMSTPEVPSSLAPETLAPPQMVIASTAVTPAPTMSVEAPSSLTAPVGAVSGTPVMMERKCAVADCVAPATFGHPGPGHVPTHCLTHCEEGMHRLAPDSEARAPMETVVSENGKRKASEALDTPGMPQGPPDVLSDGDGADGGAARTQELGRGKRVKKAATTAGEGIMLLAGAVASHSNHTGEQGEEMEQEGSGAVQATPGVQDTSAVPAQAPSLAPPETPVEAPATNPAVPV